MRFLFAFLSVENLNNKCRNSHLVAGKLCDNSMMLKNYGKEMLSSFTQKVNVKWTLQIVYDYAHSTLVIDS